MGVNAESMGGIVVADRPFDRVQFKAARERAGFTQVTLAAALDVSQATVSLWETGGRSPHPLKITAIAELLAVEHDELVEPRSGSYPHTLADLRQALGLTAAGTAARIGMRPTAFFTVERGERWLRSDELIDRWCQQLDIDRDTFHKAWERSRAERNCRAT